MKQKNIIPKKPTLIFNVLWELKKQGFTPYTIKNTDKRLKVLANNCNLNSPERVREFIATLDRKDGYKSASSFPYFILFLFSKLSSITCAIPIVNC
jgi:hypothetical protein